VGGFRLGAEGAGGECVFSSEVDASACDTYKANFGCRPCGDITEIEVEDIPHHELLTAGFPCQSFTQAGLEKGLEDARGELFFEITRILAARQPKAFILENVPNLLHIEGGIGFKRIQRKPNPNLNPDPNWRCCFQEDSRRVKSVWVRCLL